jgi:hypothetical protein
VAQVVHSGAEWIHEDDVWKAKRAATDFDEAVGSRISVLTYFSAEERGDGKDVSVYRRSRAFPSQATSQEH